MSSIFVNFINKFKHFVVWIWRQEGTPAKRSVGISVGIFSGCFPFFGLQTVLGLLLASIFKANRLLAVVGTWISNPFTYIPLYWLNYRVGSLFLGSGKAIPEFAHFNRQEILAHGWLFVLRLLLGCTLVGLFLGLLFGLGFYFMLKKTSSPRY